MELEMLTLAPEREDVLETPEITVPVADPAVETRKANEMARLIDTHLDYERQSRLPLSMDQLTPRRLCPEQRTDLVTDLYAVTR
ncbi:MAG: hypothetical protein HY321_01275 [Armatimonadetes bacterium]|nr:hypothetical protein [Armatimonadota bacterium]